jgi:hypothetical protein
MSHYVRRTRALLIAICAGACAKAAPPPPAAPVPLVALAYATSAAQPVRYSLSDSLVFEAQMARTEVASKGIFELTVAPDSASRARVTARVIDFEGRFTNGVVGASTTADERGVGGSFRITLTPRGEVLDLRRPTMTPEFQQVSRSGDIVRSLFLRLPGKGVALGASWTDTIRASETDEGMTTVNQSVVTSTWVRDTLVDTRTLRIIESRAQNTVDVTGATPAGAMRQHLAGTSTARTLWDAERDLLVTRTSGGELTGTLEVPQMGAIPVRAQIRSRIALQ